MALIPCPACEKQISDMAPACPGCGHPAAPTHPSEAAPRPGPAVQTVEQTSKQYKMWQLVGVGMMLGSAVACSQGSADGSALLLLLGLIVYVAARMGAWWNNG